MAKKPNASPSRPASSRRSQKQTPPPSDLQVPASALPSPTPSPNPSPLPPDLTLPPPSLSDRGTPEALARAQAIIDSHNSLSPHAEPPDHITEYASQCLNVLRGWDVLAFARAGGPTIQDFGVLDPGTYFKDPLTLGQKIRSSILDDSDNLRRSTLRYFLFLHSKTPFRHNIGDSCVLICRLATAELFFSSLTLSP